jgi:hypothetical protein
MPASDLRLAIDDGDVTRARELLRREPALLTDLVEAPDIPDIVDELLAAGTPIDAQVDDHPAAHWAQQQGRHRAVAHLIARGAAQPATE